MYVYITNVQNPIDSLSVNTGLKVSLLLQEPSRSYGSLQRYRPAHVSYRIEIWMYVAFQEYTNCPTLMKDPSVL